MMAKTAFTFCIKKAWVVCYTVKTIRCCIMRKPAFRYITYNPSTSKISSPKPSSVVVWFVSDLVGNAEDRFSHDLADPSPY